jgi:hypothetical protein
MYASDIYLPASFLMYSGVVCMIACRELVRQTTFFSPKKLRHWPEPATGLWASGGKRSDNLKHPKADRSLLDSLSQSPEQLHRPDFQD